MDAKHSAPTEAINDIQQIFDLMNWDNAIIALFIAAVGFPLIYAFARLVRGICHHRVSAHAEFVWHKVIVYAGSVLVIITILDQLGVKLTTLLGAAGIITVALGFAAQTSLSNMVNGIFMFWEKPFEVGDMVEIDDKIGFVLAIDMLSVKIRMLDNSMLRVPNNVIAKENTINITRFPIRRYDLEVRVKVDEDIHRVMSVLKDIAAKNKYSLDEPETWISLRTFKDTHLDIHYGVWTQTKNYIPLKRCLGAEIKARFDQEGIEIPALQVPLCTGPAKQA
tara:strand:+ start:45275 stop:46111 length:837 start_codon:yes stop_codon:yes gene_type:complete